MFLDSLQNWDEGQPDAGVATGGVAENCFVATKVRNYTWHDVSCDKSYKFVCKGSENNIDFGGTAVLNPFEQLNLDAMVWSDRGQGKASILYWITRRRSCD